MTKQKGLGLSHLFGVIFCADLFTMLTFAPLSTENTAVVMLGIVLSALFQFVLMIPVAAFADRFGERGACEVSMEKNKLLGIIVTLAYLLFFLYSAFNCVGDLGYYTGYFFSYGSTLLIAPICFTLAGIYLASEHITAIGKTGLAVFAALIFAILAVNLSLIPKSSVSELHLAQDGIAASVLRCAKADISRCEFPVLFSFLLPKLKNPGGKNGAVSIWYIGLKLIVAEIIFGFMGMALGELTSLTKVPVFTAAAYADGGIIRRFDSFFLILWAITAMVKLGLLIYCSSKCVQVLLPKTQRFKAAVFSGMIPTACVMPILASYEWERFAYGSRSVVPLIIIAFIIPIFLLIFFGKEKSYEPNIPKNAQSQQG